MPLNEGAVNEILPFAAEALEGAGDVLTLEEYRNHPMRLRGHMVGLALRELQNREARQTTHFAAGSAQFLANRFAQGVRDDGDLDKVEQAWLDVIRALVAEAMPPAYDISMTLDYFLGWHVFMGGIHPQAKAGMVPVDGRWIDDANIKHPKAWEYLQTPVGQQMCVTSEIYTQLNTAIWHTNADGTKVGWNGVGGVPKYCLDIPNRRLRAPDLRGMYAEAAGFDSLGVGGVHGGSVGPHNHHLYGNHASLTGSGSNYIRPGLSGTNFWENGVLSSGSGIGTSTKPRAYGVLPCVYLGTPK